MTSIRQQKESVNDFQVFHAYMDSGDGDFDCIPFTVADYELVSTIQAAEDGCKVAFKCAGWMSQSEYDALPDWSGP